MAQSEVKALPLSRPVKTNSGSFAALVPDNLGRRILANKTHFGLTGLTDSIGSKCGRLKHRVPLQGHAVTTRVLPPGHE